MYQNGIKTITLVALLFNIQAININNDAQIQNQFEQTSGVSKLLVDLAQLNDHVKAPLDDLKDAVAQLEEELQVKLNDLDANYAKKQALFQSNQQKLETLIGQASIDIAQSADTYENNLIPGKASSENRLTQVESFMSDNRQMLSRESLERVKLHENYVDRLSQHSNAISAIDEALQLLVGVMRGGITFAQAPMRKTIEYIQLRLAGREDYAPFIKALVDLADSVRDQESVKQVRDLLDGLRGSIVDTLNSETSNETQNQELWDQRSAQLVVEYHDFQRQINELTYQLTTYNSNIEQELQYTSSRKDDQQQYKDQQSMESSNMADSTGLNQDMRSQQLKQIQAAQDASNFINSANFDRLKSKVQP